MLEKWLIVAVIASIMSGAAYLKGRQHGSENYYALVAKLDRTTIVVQKATEKANTARKEEKARTAEVFAGLDLRLSNELPKITPLPNCAIPDVDRIRLLDSLSEAAGTALRVPPDRAADKAKEPTPKRLGLGAETGS